MTRKELQKFYDEYPLLDFSAARLEYSFYYHPEVLDIAMETFQYVPSDVDVIMEAQIAAANDAQQLYSLMRKQLSGDNKRRLRAKLVEHEKDLLPLVQKRCMTSTQDEFIENSLHFFLHARTDYTDWIVQHYRDMRSEYLKSMLCLVPGLRGAEACLPFLMEETKRLREEYPQETWFQGPLLGVHDIGIRCLGMEE